MEEAEAAASILAIAEVGIQTSLKLIAFADQVGTSPKRIQDVGTDVSVTAGTLYELAELMNDKVSTKSAVKMFHPHQIQNIVVSSTRCKEIFAELKEILGKANQQLREVHKSTTNSQNSSRKIELSRMKRMRWPFLQPSMEPLQIALGDAKGTLTLILQVVYLRHAHVTASLNREEQNDLVRVIAAIRRQQITSERGSEGLHRGLDSIESEGSDSRDPSEVRTVLEAWSVTPNVLSDEAFQHFQITPIPVSQQQMVKELDTSPQDFHEIASMLDSLSFPERDAILKRVLRNSRSQPDGSTIRSISSQSWTGSHELFGKVTSRKFNLIIERRVGVSVSSQINENHDFLEGIDSYGRERHDRRRLSPDSDPPKYDSFSNSEGDYEPETYKHESSASQAPFKDQRRRRPAQASHMPPFERRSPLNDDDWEPKQKSDETIGKQSKKASRAKVKKREKGRPHGCGDPDSQPQTESEPASDLSDEDLVGSLSVMFSMPSFIFLFIMSRGLETSPAFLKQIF